VEQLVQQSLAVGRIDDHAKAGDGEQRGEAKKRSQARALSHLEAILKIAPAPQSREYPIR
jgi:hypothetical protein